MKYFLTQIHFALDEEWISKENREQLTEDHLGEWDAENLNDLCEKLSESSGFLVNDLHFVSKVTKYEPV